MSRLCDKVCVIILSLLGIAICACDFGSDSKVDLSTLKVPNSAKFLPFQCFSQSSVDFKYIFSCKALMELSLGINLHLFIFIFSYSILSCVDM